jgi:hypothetical protein
MPSGPGMWTHKWSFQMTTSVKVSAHCASNKQVRISREDSQGTAGPVDTVLQDGETDEQHVYDGWSLSVREEVKPE